MSKLWARRLNVTASTKRSPAPVSGKVGAPVTNLASLRVSPLDPATNEVQARFGSGAPEMLLQCFANAVDVRAGDRLVVGDKEYPIRGVADWAGMYPASAFKVLVLEDIRS